MVARSQNGYRANDRSLIRTYTVPGTDVKLPVRKGQVHKVLLYVAKRFNEEVEKLHEGWCWGYAERTIRGSSTTLSNHASGTAIDLNAPAHPLGTRPSANYSRKQIRRIHTILKACDGVVRWGGDYSGRKDPMHFEINKPLHAVRALVAKLDGDTVQGRPPVQAKPHVPKFPLPRGHYFGPAHGKRSHGGHGTHNDDLARWQRRMKRRGWSGIGPIDGLYGPLTRRVCMQFQREKHLVVDGLIGPVTWRAAWARPIT